MEPISDSLLFVIQRMLGGGYKNWPENMQIAVFGGAPMDVYSTRYMHTNYDIYCKVYSARKETNAATLTLEWQPQRDGREKVRAGRLNADNTRLARKNSISLLFVRIVTSLRITPLTALYPAFER